MIRRIKSVWIVAAIPGGVVGGMRRHMELHARGLREQGVSARLVFLEDGVTHPPTLTARIPGVALLWKLLPEARREKPDVINVHTLAAPAWLAARAAGLLSSRVVVMSYAADERGIEEARGFRAFVRRQRVAFPARTLFRFASGVWCVNRQDSEFYEAEYRIAQDRLAVIPHALEAMFLERPEVERDWNQLLYVGTWIRRKGNDVLVGAVSAVLRRHPGVRLVIAGTLSSDREILNAFGDDVRARVTLHPQLGDEALRRIYNQSGLLVLPSRLEGLPFALLESMAGGCPAVAANNSGMRDVIRDGANGWLVDGFDVDAWATRIESLVADIDSRIAVSERARATAAQFDLARLTTKALAWYDGLM